MAVRGEEGEAPADAWRSSDKNGHALQGRVPDDGARQAGGEQHSRHGSRDGRHERSKSRSQGTQPAAESGGQYQSGQGSTRRRRNYRGKKSRHLSLAQLFAQPGPSQAEAGARPTETQQGHGGLAAPGQDAQGAVPRAPGMPLQHYGSQYAQPAHGGEYGQQPGYAHAQQQGYGQAQQQHYSQPLGYMQQRPAHGQQQGQAEQRGYIPQQAYNQPLGHMHQAQVQQQGLVPQRQVEQQGPTASHDYTPGAAPGPVQHYRANAGGSLRMPRSRRERAQHADAAAGRHQGTRRSQSPPHARAGSGSTADTAAARRARSSRRGGARRGLNPLAPEFVSAADGRRGREEGGGEA